MTLKNRRGRRLAAAFAAMTLVGPTITGCGNRNPVEPEVNVQQESVSKPPATLAAACVEFRGYACGQCTHLAAREFTATAPSPGCNWRGNAKDWDTNAWNAGWQVWWACPNPNDASAMSKLEGGIVVWGASASNPYGHVAFIKSGGPGGLVIYEQNWPLGAGPTFRTLPWSVVYNRSGHPLDGFILRTRR